MCKNHNGLFYRARNVGDISDDIYKVYPRKDRRPKDTSIEDTIHIDKLFYKKFGWRPRTEGVFATGDWYEASHYGNIYAFFPANGFQYVWSTKYSDLYSDFFDRILDDMINNNEMRRGIEWYCDELKMKIKSSKFEEIIGYVNYYFENDNAYVTIYNEKEQRSKEYEFIMTNNMDEIRNNLIIDAVDTYTDKNLEKCFFKNREVIFKCKYYYLINTPKPFFKTTSIDELGLT